MDIIFKDMDGTCYAMQPTIVKDQSPQKIRITLNQKGCGYFLIFCSPMSSPVELVIHDKLKKNFCALGDKILSASAMNFGDMKAELTCMDYGKYIVSGNAIILPEKAGSYSICGAIYYQEKNLLEIYLPTDKISYQAQLSVDVKYHIEPFTIERKHLFRTEQVRTPFYRLRIEDKPNYISGSLYYTIGNMPFKFPISREMLGNEVFIRSGETYPVLKSDTNGIHPIKA